LAADGPITGTVSDSSTTSGVPGITVKVEDSATQSTVLATVTTDGTGTYTTPDLAPGTYKVEFNPSSVDPDYSTQFYNDETSFASADTVTIAADGSGGTGINATLDEVPGNLSGTVTDASTHAGLGSIEVELLNSSGTEIDNTQTADNGTYTFNAEPPGNDIVEFAPGSAGADFVTQFYNGQASQGAANLVAIHGGQTAAGIDAALTPASGHVTGTVTDTTSAPSPNVSVAVFDANGDEVSNTTTGSDGTYTATDLPTGNYTVRFSPASGQNFVTQYYNGKSGIASATPVSVTTGATTPGINATLAVGGQISGSVTDGSSNAAVANVDVTVLGCTTGSNCSTTTALDGTYTLKGLATGTYYLRFSAGNGNYIDPVFSGGATEASSASPISVTAGSTTAFSQALPVGGKITGTATNGVTGTPAQGVEVEALDSSGDVVDAADTAADGTYTLTGLDTGSYKLEFFGTGFVTAFYNGASSSATATAISITRGATTGGINLLLLPASSGGRISGTVTGSNGLPISGASVTIYDTAGNVVGNGTSTDVDGSYLTAALLPGSYKVGFSTVAGNLAFQYFNAKPTLASANAVGVGAGATTANINAALAAGGTVTGTVSDATSHAPLAGVQVQLLDATGNVLAGANTRANGTYTMTGIPTGSYHVKFLANGLALPGGALYADQYFSNKVTLATSDAVGITAGANTPNINAGLVGLAGVVTAVPTPTPTPTPKPKPVAGKPKASGSSLSGLGKRKATLKFKLAAGINGAPKLKSFKVKLPKGLSFVKKGLKKGLKVTGGGKFSDKISKGVLIVTLKKTAGKVSVALTSKALSVSKSLAKSAKKHKIKSLVVTVTVTDAKKKNTTDKLTFKKPR
jgi:5-hydroxyisourate hydrolase-like protein (transthyretin family)